MFNHGGEDECFRDDTSHWDVYRPSAIEAVKLKDGAERDTHTGVFFLCDSQLQIHCTLSDKHISYILYKYKR